MEDLTVKSLLEFDDPGNLEDSVVPRGSEG